MRKLTKQQINDIRNSKAPYKELAKRYGVTISCIYYHKHDKRTRDMYREIRRKRYKNMTLEQQRAEREKQRDYQREYHKARKIRLKVTGETIDLIATLPRISF